MPRERLTPGDVEARVRALIGPTDAEGHCLWLGATNPPRPPNGEIQVQRPRLVRSRDNIPAISLRRQPVYASYPSLGRLWGDSRFALVHNFLFFRARPDDWHLNTRLEKSAGFCNHTLCMNPDHWEPYVANVRGLGGNRELFKAPDQPLVTEEELDNARAMYSGQEADDRDMKDAIDEALSRGKVPCHMENLMVRLSTFMPYTEAEVLDWLTRHPDYREKFTNVPA